MRTSSFYSNYLAILGSSKDADSPKIDSFTGVRTSVLSSPVSEKCKTRSIKSNMKWSRIGSSFNSVKISTLKEQNESEDLTFEDLNIIYAGKEVLSFTSSLSSRSRDVTLRDYKDSDSLDIKDDAPVVLSLSLEKPISLTRLLSPSTASFCGAV